MEVDSSLEDNRTRRGIKYLSNPSRHRSSPGSLMKEREGVLFPEDSLRLNRMRQQQSLPDRRYAQNNDAKQNLAYYHETPNYPVQAREFIYRKEGVSYIPAWKVIEDQPAKNFFDANPSNSTSVGVPDLYYQEQDYDANPRTGVATDVQRLHEKQTEVFMTNYLLRNINDWTKVMIRNYAAENPNQFYRPIFADDIKKEEVDKYQEKKADSKLLRDVKGRFVPR